MWGLYSIPLNSLPSWSSFSLHPCQLVLFLTFLIQAILIGVKWFLILILISIILSDNENFFMSVGHLYVFGEEPIRPSILCGIVFFSDTNYWQFSNMGKIFRSLYIYFLQKHNKSVAFQKNNYKFNFVISRKVNYIRFMKRVIISGFKIKLWWPE